MSRLNWGETLEELYGSEINFSISTFWDSGYTWQLGDEQNGFLAQGNTRTFNEAVAQLSLSAHEHFQESAFHLGREQWERKNQEQLVRTNAQ